MRRRRQKILLGAALAALGLGLGHVLARTTGGGVEAGAGAAGLLDPAAGVTTSITGSDSALDTVPDTVSISSSTVPATGPTASPTSSPSSSPSSSDVVPVAVPSSTTTRAPSTTATTAPASASTRSAPSTTRPPAAGLDRMEQGVLDAVNAARQLAGCQPLAVDSSLQAAAHAYAALLVDQDWFDHRSPDGQSPTDRARAAGYQGGVGENLMMGFKGDPAGAVNDPRYGWLQSDGHRANILNCDYRRTGVGYDPGNIQSGYADGSWVQMFG